MDRTSNQRIYTEDYDEIPYASNVEWLFAPDPYSVSPTETNIYTIDIQKNPVLSFTSGRETLQERLSEEHVAGILCLASVLFEDEVNDHIRITLNDVATDEEYPLSAKSYLDEYGVCSCQEYLEYGDSLIDENTEISTDPWREYLNSVASLSSTIPNPIIKTYTCRLRTPVSIQIVQFNTPHFLEGLIKLCTWLKYNYQDFIDYVHVGGTQLNLLPM